MNMTYWRWYKCIGNNTNIEAVKVEAKIEIKIRSWDTQWFKGLLHLIKELELDK